MSQRFAQLIADARTPFASYAQQFAQLWPIFEVKTLRQQGAYWFRADTREEVITHYLAKGINRFEPECWKRHRDSGELVPIDWPHTLAALYRVRCNLFHGEKAAHSEMDRRVVSSALCVLVHYFREARFL